MDSFMICYCQYEWRLPPGDHGLPQFPVHNSTARNPPVALNIVGAVNSFVWT